MRSCHAAAPVCKATPMINSNDVTNEDGLIDLLRVFEGSRFILTESCASGWDVDFPEASQRLRPYPCE